MAIQYSVSVRNAELDALEVAIGTAAVLKIRMNTSVPLFIGESEYISFDFTQRLQTGQTVVSAVYTCETPVTEDALTAAVNAAGTIAQARFTVPPTAADGVQYTVQCTATCTAPVATKILFATIVAQLVPT